MGHVRPAVTVPARVRELRGLSRKNHFSTENQLATPATIANGSEIQNRPIGLLCCVHGNEFPQSKGFAFNPPGRQKP